MSDGRRGLTLLELLAVVAIIGLLIAVLLPALQAARESARRAACANNLRQAGIALHLYHESYKRFPPGWIADVPVGYPGWGWASAILPYLEHVSLPTHEAGHDDKEEGVPAGPTAGIGPPEGAGPPAGWPQGMKFGLTLAFQQRAISDPKSSEVRTTIVSTFLCPSDPTPKTFFLRERSNEATLVADSGAEGKVEENALFAVARANYVGVFGTRSASEEPERGNGVFYHNSRTRQASLTDGTSHTLLVGERASKLDSASWVGVVAEARQPIARVVGWTEHVPNDVLAHFGNFSSHHVEGANFLFGDGHVRTLSDEIDLSLFRALSTRAGSEVVANSELAIGPQAYWHAARMPLAFISAAARDCRID